MPAAVTSPAVREGAPGTPPRVSASAITRPEMRAVREPLPDLPPPSSRAPLVSLSDYDEAEDITSVARMTEIGGPPSELAARDRGLLVRMDGPHAGQVLRVADQVTIGRGKDAALRLDDDGISRSHARLFVEGSEFFIEDLGSSNGTYVQSKRVGVHPLSDGDVIHFGPRVSFRFNVADVRQESLLRQLYESSVRDALTGAYNRLHFDERLSAEVAFAKRHATELSLVLFDIDYFKRVNDTYGHQAGDSVLRHVAGTVTPRLRTEDVFARYGGEEFAVILRGIDLPGSRRVGERVRTAVSASPPVFDASLIPVTVSAGTASLSCTERGSGKELVAAADRRLYVAKRTGRNRVVGCD